MLQRIMITTLSLLAFSAAIVQADPKDDIQAALQKLADGGNYSWTQTVEGGFGRGPQEGKTQDGTTWISVQMRDNTYELVTNGDKAAVKTDDGWKSKKELADAAANDDGGGGPPSPERMLMFMVQNVRTPATMSKDLVTKLDNIQKTDDGFSADLTPDAAKEQLTFRRRRPTTNPDANAPQIDVQNPKGSIKFSIKDGSLSKIEIHVTGTVSFNGNDNDVDRTTTIEIKDVGTTKIDLPADAKAKLGS